MTAKDSPIHIRADDRERNAGVIEVLAEMEGVEVRVERLDLGDYVVEGRAVFERKTLVDLVESIKDGRLFRQACNLVAGPLPPCLILEGTSADLVDSGMRREAIQGALISVTLILGIPVLRSMRPEETARLMIYAARQMRTVADGALKRPGRRPSGKRRAQLRILQGLPRVGPTRARNLLETFGSVEAVFQAHAEALVETPGIGPDTAKSIRWAVEEEAAVYRSSDCDLCL